MLQKPAVFRTVVKWDCRSFASIRLVLSLAIVVARLVDIPSIVVFAVTPLDGLTSVCVCVRASEPRW